MKSLKLSLIFDAVNKAAGPLRAVRGALSGVTGATTEANRANAGAAGPLQAEGRALDGVGKSAGAAARGLKGAGQESLTAAQRAALAAGKLASAQVQLDKALSRGMAGNFVADSLKGMGGTMLAPITGSLGRASMFEDFQVGLEVLLGGADKAQARLTELTRFASTTPFELPQVVRASTVLETLTGGALATGKGLRMVGDVAAGTNQPVEDLAVHFGRLYDALQSGRAAGESLARLQEIGAISGDVRKAIEDAQAAGAAGEEVWAIAEDSFARYAGLMERRSRTLSGQLSNLRDAVGAAGAAVGKTLLPVVRPVVAGLSAAVGWAGRLAERFPRLTAVVAIAVGGLGALAVAAGTVVGGITATAAAVAALKFSLAYLGVGIGPVVGKLGGLRAAGVALVTFARVAIPTVIAGLRGLSLAMLTTPVGWIALALAAAALLIWKFWTPITRLFSGFWAGFTEAAAPALAALSSQVRMWGAWAKALLAPVAWLGRLAGSLWELLPGMGAVEGAAGSFGERLGRIFGGVADALMLPHKLIAGMAERAGALLEKFAAFWKPAAAAVVVGSTAAVAGASTPAVPPALPAAAVAPAAAAGVTRESPQPLPGEPTGSVGQPSGADGGGLWASRPAAPDATAPAAVQVAGDTFHITLGGGGASLADLERFLAKRERDRAAVIRAHLHDRD